MIAAPAEGEIPARPLVWIDEYAAAKEATEYLLHLGLGLFATCRSRVAGAGPAACWDSAPRSRRQAHHYRGPCSTAGLRNGATKPARSWLCIRRPTGYGRVMRQ